MIYPFTRTDKSSPAPESFRSLRTPFPTREDPLMVRYWAVALLALVPAAAGVTRAGGKAEKDFKTAGKLTKDDPKDKKRDAVCQIHTVRMKKGGVYTIDMVSTQFDSYLRLEDAKGRELAEDDDSGGNLNAQIVFTCPKD